MLSSVANLLTCLVSAICLDFSRAVSNHIWWECRVWVEIQVSSSYTSKCDFYMDSMYGYWGPHMWMYVAMCTDRRPHMASRRVTPIHSMKRFSVAWQEVTWPPDIIYSCQDVQTYIHVHYVLSCHGCHRLCKSSKSWTTDQLQTLDHKISSVNI